MTLTSTPRTTAAPTAKTIYRGPTHVDSAGTAGMVQVMGRTTTGAAELPLSLRRPKEAYQFRLRFSANGHRYFQLWFTNLLVVLLTLGLAWPWARLRSQRFFHAHIQLRKQPLEFRGDLGKMMRLHALAVALVAGYAVSFDGSLRAALLGVIAAALLWPAWFRATLQARLGQTGWRGIRFGFIGSLRAAYMYFCLPVLVVCVLAVVSVSVPPVWRGTALAASAGVALLLSPWFYWLLKKYEHDHFTYAQYRTELRAGPGPFYRVFGRAAWRGLLVAVPGALVLTALAGLAWGSLHPLAGGKAWTDAWAQTGLAWVPLLGLALVVVMLVQAVVRAQFIAGMQDLLWSRTGSRVLRFKSGLPAAPLTRLLFKHGVLSVLTLGLYHPFGLVERARMQVEAVTLVSRASLDDLVSFGLSALAAPPPTASGDLMGAHPAY